MSPTHSIFSPTFSNKLILVFDTGLYFFKTYSCPVTIFSTTVWWSWNERLLGKFQLTEELTMRIWSLLKVWIKFRKWIKPAWLFRRYLSFWVYFILSCNAKIRYNSSTVHQHNWNHEIKNQHWHLANQVYFTSMLLYIFQYRLLNIPIPYQYRPII